MQKLFVCALVLALGCSKSTPSTSGTPAPEGPSVPGAAAPASPATSTTTTAGGGETRNVPSFSKLSVSGSFVVHVTMGGEGPLHLHCSDKALPKVKTDVQDGTLDVRFEDGTILRNDGPCTIDIPAARLTAITFSGSVNGDVQGALELSNVTLSGSGQLSAEQVKSDALNVTLSGSGRLRVAGKAGKVDITCSGSGDVDASGLTTDDVHVQVSGSGRVRVTASRRADTQVSGSGEVHVAGHPKERHDNSARPGHVTFD